MRELPRVTLRAVPALLMPVILLVGIYGGVTTPTEAAALAALYAFLVSTFFYRSVSLRHGLRDGAAQRAVDRVGRHPHRRGAGLQLRRHRRAGPERHPRRAWPRPS